MDLAALRGASSLCELHLQGAYLAGLQALAGLTQLKVSGAGGRFRARALMSYAVAQGTCQLVSPVARHMAYRC